MTDMDDLMKESTMNLRDVEALLQDGVIEFSGAKGKRMRFGFMAAMENEGDLYVVLTKLSTRSQLNHELLLLRLIKEDGKIHDYEVVHDAQEATVLIDQYIRMAVQSLFESVLLEGELEPQEGEELDDDEEETVLH